jgi:hypothetical protein
MYISNIPPEFNLGCATAVAALALWRGGSPERLMAGYLEGMFLNGYWRVIPGLLHFPGSFVGVAVGVVCLAASRSYWTVWACAGLLLSFVTDVIYAADAHVGRWAYLSTELVFWYVSLAAVAYGTLVRRRAAPAQGILSL